MAAMMFVACNGDSGSNPEAFCTEFENLMEMSQNVDQSTPEAMEKAVNKTLDATEKMAASLPEDQAELQKKLEGQLEVYKDIAALLEEAGYDQSKIDQEKYQEVLSRQSEFGDTQTLLLEYAQENCDINLGTTTAPEGQAPDSTEPSEGGSGSTPSE